jgi:hypothetical protein
MDRELQSVAFAEKTGAAKSSVLRMAVSGDDNMVGVVNSRNGVGVAMLCVLNLVAMWLAR